MWFILKSFWQLLKWNLNNPIRAVVSSFKISATFSGKFCSEGLSTYTGKQSVATFSKIFGKSGISSIFCEYFDNLTFGCFGIFLNSWHHLARFGNSHCKVLVLSNVLVTSGSLANLYWEALTTFLEIYWQSDIWTMVLGIFWQLVDIGAFVKFWQLSK